MRVVLDLESLYSLYPRKRGKTLGIKRLRSQIVTPSDFEQLRLAIENYAHCVKGKEAQYILHFSTFASQWRDYLEATPEVATASYSINVTPINIKDI